MPKYAHISKNIYIYVYNTYTYIWNKNKVETMYVEKQDKQMRAGKTNSLIVSLWWAKTKDVYENVLVNPTVFCVN